MKVRKSKVQKSKVQKSKVQKLKVQKSKVQKSKVKSLKVESLKVQYYCSKCDIHTDRQTHILTFGLLGLLSQPKIFSSTYKFCGIVMFVFLLLSEAMIWSGDEVVRSVE